MTEVEPSERGPLEYPVNTESAVSEGRALADPIDTMRFIAIFFMIYAHANVDFLETATADTTYTPWVQAALELHAFFYDSLCRTAAPFLGVVSGYFVYSRIYSVGYGSVVQRSVGSLVVPTMFWSIAFLMFHYAIFFSKGDVAGFWTYYFSDAWRALNYIVPITHSPANVPLHYLTDLFKLTLFAPVFIWVLLKLPVPWRFAFVVAVGLAQFTEAPVNSTNILPRWDLVTFFVLGLAIASAGLRIKDLILARLPWLAFAAAFLALVFLGGVWAPLMQSPDRLTAYGGYLVIMVIKVAGILFFLPIMQMMVRSPLFARFQPARPLIFRAFCVHIFFTWTLSAVANSQEGAWYFHELVLAQFFLVPVIVFAAVMLTDPIISRLRRLLPKRGTA